jgi:hypothetical protein
MHYRIGKKQVIYIAIVWFLFVLSFYANIFGVGLNKDWFESFQRDSSLITEKTALCKGMLTYDGPVIAKDNVHYMAAMSSNTCNMDELKPYDSQYGMQTRVISFFAPADDDRLPKYFKIVEFALAGLTALLLTAIVAWTRVKYGTIPAVVVFILSLLSPWVAGYARNTYWIEPLMLAPFVFGLVFYPWIKSHGRLWIFYAVELILVFLKFTDGYEHASTLLMSVLIPIVFYELVDNKKKLLAIWKQVLIVAALGVVAFSGAFFVNVASLTKYYGSWSDAVHQVQIRSAARSVLGLRSTQPNVITNFKATLPDAYNFINKFADIDKLADGNGPAYKYALISAINYILLPAISLPIVLNGMFGVVLQSILLFAIVGWFFLRKISNIPKHRADYSALRAAYWLSLLGALSWLILMPAHAYPHAHLNAIIVYMPFLFICYLLIGVVVRDYILSKRAAREGE